MSGIRELALAKAIGGSGGGGDIMVEPLTVTANGQYAAPSGKAYSPVGVNVSPNLEALNVSQNGTYTPGSGKDGFSQVVANVQPTLQSKTVTENGTVTPDSGYDGLSSVVVDVQSGGGTIAPLERQRNATKAIDSQGAFDPSGYVNSVLIEWQIEIGARYILYLPETVGDRFAVSMYDQEIFSYSGSGRLPGGVVVQRINSSPAPYFSVVFVATKQYLCAYLGSYGQDLFAYVMKLQYE